MFHLLPSSFLELLSIQAAPDCSVTGGYLVSDEGLNLHAKWKKTAGHKGQLSHVIKWSAGWKDNNETFFPLNSHIYVVFLTAIWQHGSLSIGVQVWDRRGIKIEFSDSG